MIEAAAAAAAALSFIVNGRTSTATAVAGWCDERVYKQLMRQLRSVKESLNMRILDSYLYNGPRLNSPKL